jgi:hypothetical protein
MLNYLMTPAEREGFTSGYQVVEDECLGTQLTRANYGCVDVLRPGRMPPNDRWLHPYSPITGGSGPAFSFALFAPPLQPPIPQIPRIHP